MKHSTARFLVIAALVGTMGARVLAHCEIPCGIYADKARVAELREHATTIEKSMNQVKALSTAQAADRNQVVRWVINKEAHADKIQHIVSQYFMTQRIHVPADDDEAAVTKYHEELALLHGILVQAMKSKQTTDVDHVEKLRDLLNAFEDSYFGLGSDD